MSMDRRQFLIASGAALTISRVSLSESEPSSFVAALRSSSSRVVALDPRNSDVNNVRLLRTWNGDFCTARLVNGGKQPVRVKEVVLFSILHRLPASTELYGEGFQMLSQTGGTLEKSIDLGYSEPGHYRIPQPDDATL
jgi:alpha-galactosidase